MQWGEREIANNLTWKALGHGGEADPGTYFVSVIGAGDKVEQPGEWVAVGIGDTANFGA